MITLKIATVDRSDLIDWRSVNLKSAMTSQIDTLEFVIKRYPSKTFKPALLDDVELLEGATKIFAGQIVLTSESIDGKLEKIKVTCKDNSHEMDKFLVVKTFDSFGTAADIVTDIRDNFLPPGFTVNNVNAPVNVNFIRFNYEQPSKCFQQLASLIGYDWYVDEDKDIHFFSKSQSNAPFNLTDTGEKYNWNSLIIKTDVKNLRNTIFVRGGTFRGTLFTEIQEADGDTKTFVQGFRYSSIVVEIDTGGGFVAQTVGIDNITDPTTVDVLYNFNEKAVKFKDSNKPAATTLVKVEGLPHIPVIIKTKDNPSINKFGDFEHKVVDKSLNSKEGARDRAQAEITKWADEIEESTFTTRESGLRVGQKINVQSDIRGIDQDFIITRINTKMRTPTEIINKVSMITTEVFGGIEFLQKLLIDKDKEIEIFEDEVLDKIEAAIETIVLSEAVVVLTEHNAQTEAINLAEAAPVVAKDAGTEFVYAPFSPPTGTKRSGIYDGAVYS